MQAKKSFSVQLFDSANYDRLKAKEQSIFEHTFNPEYTYYVGKDWVMIESIHGVLTEDFAADNLKWFIGNISFKHIA